MIGAEFLLDLTVFLVGAVGSWLVLAWWEARK